MIWEFCKYCRINGKCENQDRGHKCETGYKILFEENEKLKELLHKAKGVIAAYRLTGSINFYSNEDEECVTQIEQVLGEE